MQETFHGIKKSKFLMYQNIFFNFSNNLFKTVQQEKSNYLQLPSYGLRL